MAAKTSWRRYGTKLRHSHQDRGVTLDDMTPYSETNARCYEIVSLKFVLKSIFHIAIFDAIFYKN